MDVLQVRTDVRCRTLPVERDNARVDPQEQARQAILARPNFEVTANSGTTEMRTLAARRGERGDPQKQARQLIRQSRISG